MGESKAETKARILHELTEIAIRNIDQWDPETDHIEADNLLLEFLGSLGHQDICDAYLSIKTMWYA